MYNYINSIQKKPKNNKLSMAGMGQSYRSSTWTNVRCVEKILNIKNTEENYHNYKVLLPEVIQ